MLHSCSRTSPTCLPRDCFIATAVRWSHSTCYYSIVTAFHAMSVVEVSCFHHDPPSRCLSRANIDSSARASPLHTCCRGADYSSFWANVKCFYSVSYRIHVSAPIRIENRKIESYSLIRLADSAVHMCSVSLLHLQFWLFVWDDEVSA